MAARPHATFAHTKTVRLMVEDGMEINALEIVRSLPDFKEEITGIVPNFRGKCFNITLRSTVTTRLCATFASTWKLTLTSWSEPTFISVNFFQT